MVKHPTRGTRKGLPIHFVFSCLGNSEAIAKKSYLLVTNSDFEKAVDSRGTEKTRAGGSWYKNDATVNYNEK